MRRCFALVPACLALWALTAGVAPAAAQAPDGEALFEQHCAACHLADVVPRALAIDNMRALPPVAIVGALTDGAMQQQGADLSPAERRAIAEFITGRRVTQDAEAAAGACAASSGEWPGLDGGPLWNGWGVGVTNTRFHRLRGAVPRTELQQRGLRDFGARLETAMSGVVKRNRSDLAARAAEVNALSPLAVLGRGFAVARTPDGAIVRDATTVATGDELNLRFARGMAKTRVVAVDPSPDAKASKRKRKGEEEN